MSSYRGWAENSKQKPLKLAELSTTANSPAMQCFIYKSLKKAELYLYLDKKDDFSAVPQALFDSFGQLTFVMELQLTPERKLARESAEKVIASLKGKGFFVQMPPSTFDSLSGSLGRQH
jgi:uncharacterized protein YcgL (UPF0745 family)